MCYCLDIKCDVVRVAQQVAAIRSTSTELAEETRLFAGQCDDDGHKSHVVYAVAADGSEQEPAIRALRE